jgi:hypothetical protein
LKQEKRRGRVEGRRTREEIQGRSRGKEGKFHGNKVNGEERTGEWKAERKRKEGYRGNTGQGRGESRRRTRDYPRGKAKESGRELVEGSTNVQGKGERVQAYGEWKSEGREKTREAKTKGEQRQRKRKGRGRGRRKRRQFRNQRDRERKEARLYSRPRSPGREGNRSEERGGSGLVQIYSNLVGGKTGKVRRVKQPGEGRKVLKELAKKEGDLVWKYGRQSMQTPRIPRKRWKVQEERRKARKVDGERGERRKGKLSTGRREKYEKKWLKLWMTNHKRGRYQEVVSDPRVLTTGKGFTGGEEGNLSADQGGEGANLRKELRYRRRDYRRKPRAVEKRWKRGSRYRRRLRGRGRGSGERERSQGRRTPSSGKGSGAKRGGKDTSGAPARKERKVETRRKEMEGKRRGKKGK